MGNFMIYRKIRYVLILFMLITSVTVYSQNVMQQEKRLAPSATNFAYPQSVFVDSKSGHIWVSDFDNNRVLRFDVSSLTAVNDSRNQMNPSGFYLGQNYPNPFNPATQIKFSTKSSGMVILSVYNIIGQKIATLFNSYATANTLYSVTFEAKNLSGGVYLYSLRTPGGSEIKKMCLLK